MADSFSKQLKKEMSELYNDSFKGIRKAAFDLCLDVVKTTPVDKGDAISSWNIAIGTEDLSVTRTGNAPAESDGEVNARKSSIIPNKQSELYGVISKWNPLSEELFFSNNIEYINDLEHGMYSRGVETKKTTAEGFSKQAPAGMAKIHVNDWDNYLRKNGVKS